MSRRAWAAQTLLGWFVLIAPSCSLRNSPPDPQAVSEGSDGPAALTIKVEDTGLYRLELADLQAAGLNLASLQPAELHLSDAGQPVPYLLDGDALLFYGRASSNRYVKARAYLLSAGRPGWVMSEAVVPPAAGQPAASVAHILRLEENHVYDGRAHGLGADVGREEPWFWANVQPGDRLAVALPVPAVAVAPAALRLRLWGATFSPDVEPDHELDIWLNGQNLGRLSWDGQSYFEGELTIAAGLLRPGDNEFIFDNSGPGSAPVDIVRLDWLEVRYQAPAAAVNDRLRLPAASGDLALSGFSGRPTLLDVSDGENPLLLTGWAFGQGEARLHLATPVELLAVGPNGARRPASIEPWLPNGLRSSDNRADLIVIGAKPLLAAAGPFVEARRQGGLKVMAVNSEEIFAAFGAGNPSPEAIQSFLKHAGQNWAEPRPAYVLLIGDASYDYRNYLGLDQGSLLPAPLVEVDHGGETVSDNRLVDFDGDHKPEMAIGRWPARTPEEVAELARRTLAAERAPAAGTAVFFADGSSAEFSSLISRLLGESGWPAGASERVDGAQARQFLAAYERPQWLITYAGHGSLDRWGETGVLDLRDVGTLPRPDAAPLLLQLTCLTGFFAHPQAQSLSEALLLFENGPTLIVAASSLTLSASQLPFGVGFLEALRDPQVIRIGDALVRAKQGLDTSSVGSLREVSDTFGLLGDPSALIRRPGDLLASS
ncbi:MAG: C25 family cysteine peptidase [Candidatus Promineifilaceae bacterium]